MSIFGLETGGQIIVLQGLSTYAALFSAWYFARPVLRGETIAASKSILSEVTSTKDDVNELLEHANQILNKSETANQPRARHDNRTAVILLVVSVVLVSAALFLQVQTDPSFHPPLPAAPASFLDAAG